MREKMPNHHIPDEEELEAMLGRIKPKPGTRFSDKMSSAPWFSDALTGETRKRKSTRRYVWGTFAFVVVLLFLAIVFIPSVRVIARQIIYSFIYNPTNQLEVQVTLASPGDLYNYSDPANFSLSVDNAQREAGFNLKQLTSISEGLKLVGARYDAKVYSVTQLYEGVDFQLFLTQRPLGHGSDVFTIGSDAQVKLVMVGDVQAEYVTGGWEAVSTQPAPDSTPISMVNISAVWDDSLPQSTLRWQSDGIVYELRSLGEGGLSQSDLINLANGLK